MYHFGTGGVSKRYAQDIELQDTGNTVNVNGGVKDDKEQRPHHEPDRIDLRKLPDLAQGCAETQYVANLILTALGDEHSQAFYYLVAAKVPEHMVRKTLSEIKNDGAHSPARVFAHRMKQYAAEALAGLHYRDLRSSLAELIRRKIVSSHAQQARG